MGKTALSGGMLIDGSGGEPIFNSLVLVEDKKIVYAGAAKPYGADYGTRDISGKTVMPGLVDTHLHFSGNLTADDTEWVLEDVIQKTVVAVQQAHGLGVEQVGHAVPPVMERWSSSSGW